jgi:glucose-6-phosphate isomerase
VGQGFSPAVARRPEAPPHTQKVVEDQTMQSPLDVSVDLATGRLRGAAVAETTRTLADLAGLFGDECARVAMPASQVVYQVQAVQPSEEGRAGGLCWGNTTILPGDVGGEYFMTKGHFHALRDRDEYYVTVSGEGALILMDAGRRTWMEPMRAGSVHYIRGALAHRTANTGRAPLVFLACWPADAGHDYETIARDGFGARLKRVDGVPRLVPR